MDHSDFKTSEELGLSDDDVLFMSSFSNRLQLEPFPTATGKRNGILISVMGLATVAAVLLWFVWPLASSWGQVYFSQFESSFGVSISVLFGLISLCVAWLIEGGSDQAGDLV